MRRLLIIAVVTAALLPIPVASLALGANDAVASARAATARFNSTVQAQRAGYAPFPDGVPLSECIAATDGPGAMGYHWVNLELLDGELDVTKPEVLVYAPRQNGKLQLVALEYVVFDADWADDADPRLFGLPLTRVSAPNRYEIPTFWQRHLWLYERNELGLFADFNPAVTC